MFNLLMRREVSVSLRYSWKMDLREFFHFFNTCHCIRIPNFTSILKLGANKHFVGNRFHALLIGG